MRPSEEITARTVVHLAETRRKAAESVPKMLDDEVWAAFLASVEGAHADLTWWISGALDAITEYLDREAERRAVFEEGVIQELKAIRGQRNADHAAPIETGIIPEDRP